jgi:hypothetical protein
MTKQSVSYATAMFYGLQLSKRDIKNGKLISQSKLDKNDLLWLKDLIDNGIRSLQSDCFTKVAIAPIVRNNGIIHNPTFITYFADPKYSLIASLSVVKICFRFASFSSSSVTRKPFRSEQKEEIGTTQIPLAPRR